MTTVQVYLLNYKHFSLSVGAEVPVLYTMYEEDKENAVISVHDFYSNSDRVLKILRSLNQIALILSI